MYLLSMSYRGENIFEPVEAGSNAEDLKRTAIGLIESGDGDEGMPNAYKVRQIIEGTIDKWPVISEG